MLRLKLTTLIAIASACSVQAQPPKLPFPRPAKVTPASPKTAGAPSTPVDEVVELLQGLASGDASKRLTAIENFSGFGALAADDVSGALTEALGDSNDFVRHAALQTLGAIGPNASRAYPSVLEMASSSENRFDQLLAIWAAARIVRDRSELLELVPPAVAALGDEDESVRGQAVRAVLALGRVAHPALVAKLENADGNAAVTIIQILGQTGARTAIDELTNLLTSDDNAVRLASIVALGEIGPASKNAVPGLVSFAANDSDEAIRLGSIRALRRIGVADPEVLAVLTTATADKSGRVAVSAIETLGELTGHSTLILELMPKLSLDSRPQVLATAFAEIAEMGPAALPMLVSNLENEQLRYWSLLSIGELGPAAKEAVPALFRYAGSSKPGIRREAFIALAKVGVDSVAVRSVIEAGLNDTDAGSKYAAVFAAGSLKANTETIVSELKTNLSTEDDLLRMLSSWALARISPNPLVIAQSTKELIKGLNSEDDDLRSAAMMCLANLPPNVAQLPTLLPGLLASATTGSTDAQQNAADVIASIASQGGAGKLLDQAIRAQETRPIAITVVTRLGAKASPSVPALIDAMSDPRAPVRRDIAIALGSIGAEAAAAVRTLREAIRDDTDINVRRAAAIALGRIGPAASSAVADLQKAIDDVTLQSEAAWALAFIDPDDPGTIKVGLPVLVRDLDADRPITRRESANAIANLGSAALAAREAILYASEDSDEAVRAAAFNALTSLQGE